MGYAASQAHHVPCCVTRGASAFPHAPGTTIAHAALVIHRSGLFIAALVGQGCLPFALPPGKAALGVGGRYYDSGLDGAGATGGNATTWQLRAALHPLGLVRSLKHRSVDFGVGYSTEQNTGKEPTEISGPFLDLEVFPVHFGRERRLRLGAIVSPLLILSDPGGFDDGVDAGLDLRIELEGTGFSDGSFNTADDNSNDEDVLMGFAYGEWALGAWVGGGLRSMGDTTVWAAALGVGGRWPAVAGVVCCADLTD